MSLSVQTNQAGANSEYRFYVSGPMVKTDKINSPDLLDFTLINYDGNMVKLVRGTHIVVSTSTYGVWFTGYITNEPTPVYLGTKKNIPQWQYNYQATGAEYLLNLKPFGIMRPFINTTQGAIIKALINRLTPAGVTFDVSGIQDGQYVPRFVVDPNKHFTEIVNNFAQSAHYAFQVRNFVATYKPLDAAQTSISVDGNSQHFTPASLSMKPSSDPIINDSIVLGAIEPQNYMTEYFMGDGATAQFPLLSSVFGVDSTLLLDDDMSGSNIDTSKWTVYDATGSYLQPYGGTLNVLGGSNNSSLDVYLQSANLIPLEGTLRCTHGEWDFVSASDGVLGGLWTGNCNGSMTGLLFGIRATKSGSNTVLKPVVNGVVDSTQSVTASGSKRYVMRTVINFGETKRYAPSQNYRDAGGTLHTLNLSIPSVHPMCTTTITEIDPLTAAMTNQWIWTNDLGTVSASYGYYVPVASNDVHATVCSVTVSVPMQAALSVKSPTDTAWKAQIIGPNEVDALDGLAPAATVVDSNNGAQTRSSLLGSANYNPGQATLTYFKNSTQLISYLPQPGTLIQLQYRGAGAAVGRVQNKSSIEAEATSWGDDGVRSETKRDLNPLPRTSAECELAAAARVQDNSYQHWSGTYTMPSGSWFSGEPVSGTILKFKNLPAQFPPTVQAEETTQVKSTMVADNPREVFIHEISFGPISTVDNVLAAIKSTDGVFTPQDTAQVPQFIDVSALGSSTVAAVPTIVYVGKDSSNWNFKFLDAIPAGLGVEIRYTDSGWGADDGKNLVKRLASGTTTFSIPRTTRGKVVFLRCYDTRNKLLYSEDMTQSAWVKSGGVSSVTKVKAKDINNCWRMVSKISYGTSYGNVQQASSVPCASTYGAFTADILGPAGAQIILHVEQSVSPFSGSDKYITMTGRWQRVSYTFPAFTSGQSGNIQCSFRWPGGTSAVVYVSRASLEINQSSETVYCKTNSTVYGAASRFSAGLHTALPMIPPSPTASGDFTDTSAPVVSAVLPADLTDVWGCEIRAGDNSTVLFKTDLVNAQLTPPSVTGGTTMVLQYTGPQLANRTYDYWLYTYNLFGEYSAGYHFAGTLTSLPADVSTFTCSVSGTSLVLNWNSVSGAAKYEIRYTDQPWPNWGDPETILLWSGTATTWTDTTIRSGTYMVKPVTSDGWYSLNPNYVAVYPAPPVVTISASSTNGSGSGGSTSAGDAITVSSTGITATSKVWVTVTWTWGAGYRAPTTFNVVIYTGSDATNAANYLVPMATVDGSLRTYTVAVTPTTSMSAVSAAVRAVYA